MTPHTSGTPREGGGSYGRLARSGGAWTVLRQVLSMGVQVPTAIVMARLLTPSEFGVAVAASLMVQLGRRMTQFGLNAALVRHPDLRREHETSVFVFNVASGLAMWGLLSVAAPWVGRFFGSSEAGRLVPLAAAVFVITPLGTVPGCLLVRQLRYKELSALAFIDTLVGALTTIALAWLGFSYWSIPIGMLMSTIVFTTRQYTLAGWKIGFHFSWPAFRELLSFGAGLQSKQFVQFLAANVDLFVVGRLSGITEIGYYDRSTSTVKRVTEPLGFATSVTFRVLAGIAGDEHRFRRAYQKTIVVIGLLAIPVLLGLSIMADELLRVAYGPQWAPSAPSLRWLSVAAIFRIVSLYVGNATDAVGHAWRQAAGQTLSLVVLLIAVVLGVRWYGPAGAAGGVTIAAIVEAAVSMAVLGRSTTLGWRELLAPLKAALWCAAGLVSTLLATRIVLGAASVVRAEIVLAVCCVGACCYMAGFLLLCRDQLYVAAMADIVDDERRGVPIRVRQWLSRHFRTRLSSEGVQS